MDVELVLWLLQIWFVIDGCIIIIVNMIDIVCVIVKFAIAKICFKLSFDLRYFCYRDYYYKHAIDIDSRNVRNCFVSNI